MNTSQANFFDSQQIIHNHVVDATVDLFDAYGASVVHTSSDEEPARSETKYFVTGNTGYTGDGISGCVLIFTDVTTAKVLSASLVGDTTEECLCDAIGEFSNMLLGRLKNRLLAHDVVLSVATPTGLIGRQMRVLSGSAGVSRWHCFDGERISVYVRLDLTLDRTFSMNTIPKEQSSSVAAVEGDMLLF